MRSARSSASAVPSYCPDRGDIIDINFDPQEGREQAGRRPALVLSPRAYNEKARLCVLCPITNQAKGYPFEVSLPSGVATTGVILSDQAKSLSWEGRKAGFREVAPDATLGEVLGKLRALIGV
jgi:mRNA interferase MazF